MKEIEIIIKYFIDNNPAYNDEIKRRLNSSIDLIMNNNFFIFNGKFYKQTEGALMG